MLTFLTIHTEIINLIKLIDLINLLIIHHSDSLASGTVEPVRGVMPPSSSIGPANFEESEVDDVKRGGGNQTEPRIRCKQM